MIETMSETGEGDARALLQLRNRIDAIDAEMHRLLIERGTVIDELIRTKRLDRPGAAFRPDREADMMRRIVARHEGKLPVTIAEHIWREIISTFTNLQSPFDVFIDLSVDAARMRDLARFVFGFSMPVTGIDDPAAVVAAVAGHNALGIVTRAAQGAWWRRMRGPGAPRIMACLPFIAMPNRPADLPAFVISPPLASVDPPDIVVFALSVEGPFERPAGTEVLATSVEAGVSEVLLAAPGGEAPMRAADLLAGGVRRADAIGGFARGITLGGRSTLLYEGR
jgi:chorismate mutase